MQIGNLLSTLADPGSTGLAHFTGMRVDHLATVPRAIVQ